MWLTDDRLDWYDYDHRNCKIHQNAWSHLETKTETKTYFLETETTNLEDLDLDVGYPTRDVCTSRDRRIGLEPSPVNYNLLYSHLYEHQSRCHQHSAACYISRSEIPRQIITVYTIFMRQHIQLRQHHTACLSAWIAQLVNALTQVHAQSWL